MSKCLFFLSLCFLPFVAFSSTLFTSQNPIDLPTTTTTTTSGKSVLDVRGEPLDSQATYRIVSIFWGALGGDVYLGRSPNSTILCPNGVFRYNSDIGPRGTPVKFTPSAHFGPGIFEDQYINIQFKTTKLCVDYSVWKVGDYDVSLGARLLETDGTIGQQFCSGSWFKIVKASLGYNLLYCPGPFVCPSCPIDQCQTVGEVNQNGRRRLALVKDNPLGVNFSKV